jgi:hypothetical protein
MPNVASNAVIMSLFSFREWFCTCGGIEVEGFTDKTAASVWWCHQGGEKVSRQWLRK